MSRVMLLALVCSCTESPLMDSAEIIDANQRVPDLVCPGARGCRSASGALFAGAARRVITPAVEGFADPDGNNRPEHGYDDHNANGVWDPVWLAGFDQGRAATGVHDDLWASAVSLRQGDTRVGLVSLDLVGLFNADVLRVRRAAVALGYDHVMVAATHQHQGPDPMGLWGANLKTGRDPAWVDRVVAEVTVALREAKEAEVEVSLSVAVGEAPELVSDSRKPIVLDQAITVATLSDTAGAARVVLVIWGNHPEALGGGNTVVSSDYTHFLRQHLEAQLPGARVVFFAGNLGGLANPLGGVVGCPDHDGVETCPVGTFERAAYIGEGAAAAALAAMVVATDAEPRLSLRRHSFLTGTGNLVMVLAMQLGLIERTTFAGGKPLAPDEFAVLSAGEVMETVELQTEVNLVRLGPLELLTVPGELYPELWLEGPGGESLVERPVGGDYPDAAVASPLSSLLTGQVRAVINQANDSLGYIIPKTQYDLEAPHAYDPDGQYGEETSLGPDMEPDVHDAVRELVSLKAR